jgi:hypothetical protein
VISERYISINQNYLIDEANLNVISSEFDNNRIKNEKRLFIFNNRTNSLDITINFGKNRHQNDDDDNYCKLEPFSYFDFENGFVSTIGDEFQLSAALQKFESYSLGNSFNCFQNYYHSSNLDNLPLLSMLLFSKLFTSFFIFAQQSFPKARDFQLQLFDFIFFIIFLKITTI